MNIAPFLIARLNNWPLPEDPVVERGLAAIEANSQYVRFPIRAFGFTEVVDIFDEPARPNMPVGLYSVRLSRWGNATSQTMENAGPELFDLDRVGRPLRFVRGIVIEPIERILLFPDDARPQTNFSLFVPMLSESHDVVLHTVAVFMEHDDEQPAGRVIADDNGCSLSVSGEFPNRYFSCARTGCTHGCRHGRRIEGNSVKTIYCEC